MRYGFIIAAGKQTRFGLDLPKALVDIDGVCLLDRNIKLLRTICDTVYVVCSSENIKYFDETKYRLIEIESGYGSGDALYKAMNRFFFSKGDQVVVCWGDVILNKNIVSKLDENTTSAIIPCTFEERPYVRFEFDKSKVSVYFSKYGDEIKPVYHDMSIFKFDAKNLKRALFSFVECRANPDNTYNGNNNEFELLEIFNNGYPGELLVVDSANATKSFNTVEELNRYKMEVANE